MRQRGEQEDKAGVVLMVEETQGPSLATPDLRDEDGSVGLMKQPPIFCHVLFPVSSSADIHAKQGKGNTKIPQWRFHEMLPMNPSYIFFLM